MADRGKKQEYKFMQEIMLCACVVLVLGGGFVSSVEGRSRSIGTGKGDEMITEYFRIETAKLSEKCLADVTTVEDWKIKRAVYKKELFEMLGMEPMPEKTDLKAVITGTLEHEDFIVEKIHFQASPGLYVTGNLYIPKKLEKPAPTILYVCGHSAIYASGHRGVEEGGISYGNKAVYQHHPCWFAQNGYVCFIIDTLQLGEIEGIHHGTYKYNMWWWNSRGYSSAGVEAWFSIRALDYLETRKEVDSERFGVTGISGGGVDSWWIAALDERIKAAVPVAGIDNLQTQVVEGCVEGQCDCIYHVNTYLWDYPQVAALVAPRALLISNSDKDTIFPMDGVVQIYKKAQKIYELYGAERNLGLHITEGPHADTQELRVHAFTWFDRFLKGKKETIEKPALPLFEPKELKVFETLPSDSINMQIHETFTAKADKPAVPETAEEWARQRNSWMKALREKSFRGWPEDGEAGGLDIEKVFSVERDGIILSAFDFTSQEPIRLRLYLLQRAVEGDKARSIVLRVLSEEDWGEWLSAMRAVFAEELSDQSPGEANAEAFERYKRMFERVNVAVGFVGPRGIGPTAWNRDERKRVQVRRRFMLLGQTLDGMRVWDVRRAIQAVRSIDGVRDLPIRLRGEGQMGGIVLYASLFEADINRVDMQNLPASHREGPTFLNVLRYLDMPCAAAMAAKRSRVRLYQKEGEGGWEYPRAVAEKLCWPEGQFEVREGAFGGRR